LPHITISVPNPKALVVDTNATASDHYDAIEITGTLAIHEWAVVTFDTSEGNGHLSKL